MRHFRLFGLMASAFFAVQISTGNASAATLLTDGFSGPSLDTNKWQLQAYAKGTKGSFGRAVGFVTDTAPNPDVAAGRFAVKVNATPDNNVEFTSIASKTKFSPPAAGQYVQYSAKVKINWSSARQHGLVFGISAYGKDANQNEDAVNFEFVTEQINPTTAGVQYDRLLLSSYDDYNHNVSTTAGKWFSYVDSQVNSTDGYHVYTMRIFSNKVEFQIDNSIIQTVTDVVPKGDNLSFVLNAWAPDSNWSTAEAPLPANSFWYMDVDWATISDGTTVVPEPATIAALALPAISVLLRRRRGGAR